ALRAALVAGSAVLMVFATSNIMSAGPRPSADVVADQQVPVRPLITDRIDETNLVTLARNTRPEANAKNDLGRLLDSFPVEHVWLQLRRSPEQERAVEK